MDPARWNEIIRAAAAQAIDELAGSPTIQDIALRAATLSAEWICEEMTKDAEAPPA